MTEKCRKLEKIVNETRTEKIKKEEGKQQEKEKETEIINKLQEGKNFRK